jgi:hypothetical protein
MQDWARYGSQGSIPLEDLFEERKELMIVNRRYHLNKQGETPENVRRRLAASVIGE